ncbi:MAG: hypothetical protein NTU52_02005 [Actinobacteria bacterium]|nr:hypothetical protein [Actinomycetota bacterium]
MPKPKQHDPAERMLNLLALLGNNSQPQTLEQIMDQMGAEYGSSDEGRRTSFERDKASLREICVVMPPARRHIFLIKRDTARWRRNSPSTKSRPYKKLLQWCRLIPSGDVVR